MKKITSALVAMSMTLALAGISFAQSAPAPDTTAPATHSKTEKKAKKAPKAKKTKKSAAATPSK